MIEERGVGVAEAVAQRADSPIIILAAHSDTERRYAYRILKVDPAVLPVIDYASEIAVEAAGEGSVVRWSGRFDAPAGVADAAAQEAIGGVYSGGLEAVKAAFGD